MIINNNEGSSWYSRKKSAWYCKPWIKLAAFIRSLYFAISLYKNYFSSPKIAKTNTVLRCYAYLYIFLRKLDRKQPSNTTHGRCLTSKSTKVPDRKKNKHVFLSSDKNTHNNNPTFCTQKIQTHLSADEWNQISSRQDCTVSSKHERPLGIFPQSLISSCAIRKHSMPPCTRISTDSVNSLLDEKDPYNARIL